MKRECGSLSDLNEKEWVDLREVVKKMELTLKKAFGATMFNWGCLMNDAYQSKNPKPQVHFHFRPRYQNKVEILGEVFEDKDFGHHYIRGSPRKVSLEIQKEIIKKIQKELTS